MIRKCLTGPPPDTGCTEADVNGYKTSSCYCSNENDCNSAEHMYLMGGLPVLCTLVLLVRFLIQYSTSYFSLWPYNHVGIA